MIPGVIEQFEAIIQALDDEAVAGIPQGDTLIALLALQSRLDAQIARRVDAFHHSGDWMAGGAQTPAGWLRVKTRGSRHDSARQVRIARATNAMPATFEAWVDGSLTSKHVEAIVKVRTIANAHELFAEYEPVLVATAQHVGPEDIAGIGAQWFDALNDHLDRDGADTQPGDNDTTARRDHEVFFSRGETGCGYLHGNFDVEGAEYVQRALDRAYEHAHCANDARSSAEQRADALVAICQRYLEGLPASGNRPNVLFLNELDDYLGHVIGRAQTSAGHRIATTTIRRHVCNANINVLDTLGGIPLNLGRTTRLFTNHQYKALVARDGGCRGPGCHAPPERCEAHHLAPWKPPNGAAFNGGETNMNNGILACRGRCHRQLHEGGWIVAGDANGTLTFTTRTGRIVGTSDPRTPNTRYLTEQGDDHNATRQRVHWLLHDHPINPVPNEFLGCGQISRGCASPTK